MSFNELIKFSTSSPVFSFLQNSSEKNLSYLVPGRRSSHKAPNNLMFSFLFLIKRSLSSLIFLCSSFCLSMTAYLIISYCLIFSSTSSLALSLFMRTSSFFLSFSASSFSYCSFILGSFLYAMSTNLMILALSFLLYLSRIFLFSFSI